MRSCKESKTLKVIAKEQKTIDSLRGVVQIKNEQLKASEERERSVKPLIDSLIQKSKNVQLKINQNEKQIRNDTNRIRYFSDDELADFFTEYLRKKGN
jgi:ribosomal protein L17